MKRLAAPAFATLMLALPAARAQAPAPAPAPPAGSPAAQMTTCSTQAKQNAQTNPGMPAGSTHPVTDANGALDDCRQKDNGAPGNTATGH